MNAGLITNSEAHRWVANSGNHAALAPNRFQTNAESLQYIAALYSLGAVNVSVDEDCIRDDPATLRSEGGPWADGILVSLSEDIAKRHAVLNMCSREVFRKVLPDGRVSVWWD